jgi:hypothetical protein
MKQNYNRRQGQNKLKTAPLLAYFVLIAKGMVKEKVREGIFAFFAKNKQGLSLFAKFTTLECTFCDLFYDESKGGTKLRIKPDAYLYISETICSTERRANE